MNLKYFIIFGITIFIYIFLGCQVNSSDTSPIIEDLNSYFTDEDLARHFKVDLTNDSVMIFITDEELTPYKTTSNYYPRVTGNLEFCSVFDPTNEYKNYWTPAGDLSIQKLGIYKSNIIWGRKGKINQVIINNNYDEKTQFEWVYLFKKNDWLIQKYGIPPWATDNFNGNLNFAAKFLDPTNDYWPSDY